MKTAREILRGIGGQSATARALGLHRVTVSRWAVDNVIPAAHWTKLINLSRERGVPLSADDLLCMRPFKRDGSRKYAHEQ